MGSLVMRHGKIRSEGGWLPLRHRSPAECFPCVVVPLIIRVLAGRESEPRASFWKTEPIGCGPLHLCSLSLRRRRSYSLQKTAPGATARFGRAKYFSRDGQQYMVVTPSPFESKPGGSDGDPP